MGIILCSAALSRVFVWWRDGILRLNIRRRLPAAMVLVLAVVGGLCLAAGALGTSGEPALLASSVLWVVGLALCGLALSAIGVWSRSPSTAPEGVRWRPEVDHTLWGLVRHLNSYRTAGPDTMAAVRELLWALAHTDRHNPEHCALIADLAGEFPGWDERDAASLREATSRVWASLPTTS